MAQGYKIKSVAIIGAGASGAITATAFKAENYFERIRVFERREKPGGTWIYDADPHPALEIHPGHLPPDIDPPLALPDRMPCALPPSRQERYSLTPVYDSLTTNVPDIAMCFSDERFARSGPFVPHYIPRQYVENYVATHRIDDHLVLNTTVEDVTKLRSKSSRFVDAQSAEQWKLTLRKYDAARHIDIWWEEVFDAVVIANGHYSVPYIPDVSGLQAYAQVFPSRVVHSKYYRTPAVYAGKRVLVIGNSASGHDITTELLSTAARPLYQSRRSKSRWDGRAPPEGIVWKPVISAYDASTGTIRFADGTTLGPGDVDAVIYCTGYQPSFPFWNSQNDDNDDDDGGLWDYARGRLVRSYWHMFFRDHPTLAAVGVPRVLTFRSFEYQAIALARLWSGRNARDLPSREEQERWERERERERQIGAEGARRKFHDIAWETGETREWLGLLFEIAGLGTLAGDGRIPPVLSREMIWALEHIKKYPEPDNGEEDMGAGQQDDAAKGDEGPDAWVIVPAQRKDLLAFI